jgi:hypothetical protein
LKNENLEVGGEHLQTAHLFIIYPCRVNIKMMVGHGLDSTGSRHRQVRGFCEHGNEYSHSIKCVESFDR